MSDALEFRCIRKRLHFIIFLQPFLDHNIHPLCSMLCSALARRSYRTTDSYIMREAPRWDAASDERRLYSPSFVSRSARRSATHNIRYNVIRGYLAAQQNASPPSDDATWSRDISYFRSFGYLPGVKHLLFRPSSYTDVKFVRCNLIYFGVIESWYSYQKIRVQFYYLIASNAFLCIMIMEDVYIPYHQSVITSCVCINWNQNSSYWSDLHYDSTDVVEWRYIYTII